jgi:Na+-transporting methylmalonyl-CoA/oxaloacetate decarboxylase beta subunit
MNIMLAIVKVVALILVVLLLWGIGVMCDYSELLTKPAQFWLLGWVSAYIAAAFTWVLKR